MNTSEAETLFARTLLGDYEDEDAWKAIRALHMDGSREILEHAAGWLLADDPLKRARAAATPEWTAADYKTVLMRKFQIPDYSPSR